jgi:hypothetical protein
MGGLQREREEDGLTGGKRESKLTSDSEMTSLMRGDYIGLPEDRLEQFSGEYRVKDKLLRYYDKTSRPVINDSTTIRLYVGISLYHILDTVSNAALGVIMRLQMYYSHLQSN